MIVHQEIEFFTFLNRVKIKTVYSMSDYQGTTKLALFLKGGNRVDASLSRMSKLRVSNHIQYWNVSIRSSRNGLIFVSSVSVIQERNKGS